MLTQTKHHNLHVNGGGATWLRAMPEEKQLAKEQIRTVIRRNTHRLSSPMNTNRLHHLHHHDNCLS